jgi:hypothetical protein
MKKASCIWQQREYKAGSRGAVQQLPCLYGLQFYCYYLHLWASFFSNTKPLVI